MRLYTICGDLVGKTQAIIARRDLTGQKIQVELIHPHEAHANEIKWEDTYFSKYGDKSSKKSKVGPQVSYTREQEYIYNTGMTYMDILKKASKEMDDTFIIAEGGYLNGKLQTMLDSIKENLQSKNTSMVIVRQDPGNPPILAFKKEAVETIMETLSEAAYNIFAL